MPDRFLPKCKGARYRKCTTQWCPVANLAFFLQNLPNQLVLRLGSTFLVLENEDRITVSRSIIIVGDAATENHVSMIAISNPIEFTSQATLSRVHILKPRGMDFSVYFNYENGLVGKVSLNFLLNSILSHCHFFSAWYLASSWREEAYTRPT